MQRNTFCQLLMMYMYGTLSYAVFSNFLVVKFFVESSAKHYSPVRGIVCNYIENLKRAHKNSLWPFLKVITLDERSFKTFAAVEVCVLSDGV